MTASEQIDKYIESLTGWQKDLIVKLRKLAHEADSEIVEEWKWDTPVFSHNGMVCALGVFKDHIKINFFKGASLADPDKMFNSGLEAKRTRTIDLREGDEVEEVALKVLIRTAVDANK